MSTIAIKRVNSGAVESQSQRPPFSEEEERNIADEAKASRAKNLKIDSPVKAEDFGSPIVARSCPNLKSNKPACAERDNATVHRAAANDFDLTKPRGPVNGGVIRSAHAGLFDFRLGHERATIGDPKSSAFTGESILRFFALLALASSAIFLSSSSLNGGLWDWLSTAPLLTRLIAIVLTAIGLSFFAINATGLRPKDLELRTWRNIGFLATTAACAVLMVTMTMFAIRTNFVPEWLPVSGFVLFLIGGFGWVHFYARRHGEANAG